MMYIYDLLINLNNCDYNFYEWKETDNIDYLKKGLLIKTSEYIYKKLISNNIIIGDKTLNLLKDKSCILRSKRVETIPYMAVFTDGKDTIGISFSKEGKIISKTRFTIQDELELLEESSKLKTTRIDYKEITNSIIENTFKTREEKEIINYILTSLMKIRNNKDKIEYLYYEWFNKKSNTDNIYDELIMDIKKNYSEERKDFLKLLELVIVKNNA